MKVWQLILLGIVILPLFFVLSVLFHQFIFNYTISQVFSLKAITFNESLRMVLYYSVIGGYMRAFSSNSSSKK